MIAAPANAAVASFPCGTSGSYDVADGVLTGHSDCRGDLNVDSSVVEIANDAFASNTNLAAISIPGNVITVGENAFAGASATSVSLGEGIIELKGNAFANLNNFGNRILDISIPDSVTTLGVAVFQQNRLGKIVIGDSVTNIPQQAFYQNFGGGARSIDFGSSVVDIGPAAFFGYAGDTLYFPDSLETIQSAAFEDARAATTVLLPASISSIAGDAFQISPTTTLYCGSNPVIANYAFPVPNNAKVCGNLVRFEQAGTSNPRAQQVSSTSANLTSLNWTKQDSTFVKWTSNRDGTGAQYFSGAVFPFNARFTILYPQWRVTPRVIFDSNTGFGEMDDQVSAAAANLDELNFSKCGFDFTGWSTNQNGGPTTYPDQASFPFVDDETRLFAQWRSLGLDRNRVRADVTWNPLNGSSGPNAFANGTVLTMAVNPVTGVLYAGGTFRDVAGIAEADYIAEWDGSNWSALSSNGSGNGALDEVSGAGSMGVYDLAFDSLGNLFATGRFSISGAASYVAKWNGTSWSSVGTGSEFGNSGRAIVVDSRDHLYVGGHFRDVAGDSTTDYLAKWDGAQWGAVGNAGLDEVVKTIDIGLNDSVYIGTYTRNIAGIREADYIAKWNGSAWSALGGTTAGNGQLNGMPRIIRVDPRSGVDVVYVGGVNSQFQAVNGDSAELGFLAKWNGSQWGQALPDVVISDNHVADVALAPGGGLVVVGWFSNTDYEYGDSCNSFQRSLAYFDGTNTIGLGLNDGDPSFNDNIDSVVFNQDGQLVVGGSFRSASGNSSASRIAISNINPQQTPRLTRTPAFEYLGPEVLSISRGLASAGDVVTIYGKKLDLINSASIDDLAATIVNQASQSITVAIPAGLADGLKSIVFLSSFGKLEYIRALTIKNPVAADTISPTVTKKITLVPTKNSVLIYLKGYQGQTLTWKIAGKWQSIQVTGSYQVFRRATIWSEYEISVDVYVGRELLLSKSLTTQ